VTRIGFIGFGSMGSMLINGFIESGVLLPDQITIASINKEKLKGKQ
jgi:pyrroline-5-carboxylate reductase